MGSWVAARSWWLLLPLLSMPLRHQQQLDGPGSGRQRLLVTGGQRSQSFTDCSRMAAVTKLGQLLLLEPLRQRKLWRWSLQLLRVPTVMVMLPPLMQQ